MQSIRLLPPTDGRSAITVFGRSFNPTAAAYVDVECKFADALEVNGWTRLAQVGTSAERPPLRGPSSGNPIVAAPGVPFIDTTLSLVIAIDQGGTWRNVLTGAPV